MTLSCPIMLSLLNKSLRRLCSRLLWPKRHRFRPKISIKRFGKKPRDKKATAITNSNNGSAMVHPNNCNNNNTTTTQKPKTEKPIRIATFNAALFSMAPALPEETPPKTATINDKNSHTLKLHAKSANERPKSILKHSPLHPSSTMKVQEPHKNLEKSKLRVSINLPDNEISLLRSRQSSFSEHDKAGTGTGSNYNWRSIVMRQCVSFSGGIENGSGGCDVYGSRTIRSSRTVVEVLRELDADVVGLQDVKAEEGNEMKPLSDLAKALGMNYVFAESWAPEYGNAVLSRWPIKRCIVQKVFDDTDFRNVLKATIDVPEAGEMNFYCTHLDHLDENWRMKQINAIIQSNDEPHILAGGLNSLDESDYSQERWTDIVKYYEEMGKPTPKVEVMKYLKSRNYTDAKDFAGECESVVMIAKGQSVQGTCKYGTRVDYILSSSDSAYKFVPGSYHVLSSKGTSDHHIVKVDVVKVNSNPNSPQENNVTKKKQRTQRQKVARITHSSPSTCIWKTHSVEID